MLVASTILAVVLEARVTRREAPALGTNTMWRLGLQAISCPDVYLTL